MANGNNQKKIFNNRGGVIVTPLRMIKSDAWLNLSPPEKVLLTLMQTHWQKYEYVSYGVREAASKIGCSMGTAAKAFKNLEKAGFIKCSRQSDFNSRTGSKSREWRLTWMPFDDKDATNDWEKVN